MKNNIDVLWPTLIGRFINPNHQEIKEGLIKFFEDYQKKDPKGKLGRENHNYTKVTTIYINMIMNILRNF